MKVGVAMVVIAVIELVGVVVTMMVVVAVEIEVL